MLVQTCVVSGTVLNCQNTEFHPKLMDLLDQFALCTDENLGVACVCKDVVEQVVD